jgi:hypothetical protein
MLRRVIQEHDTGCFIGCMAILLDVSYQEAFRRIHPGRECPPRDAYWRQHQVGIDPEKAIDLMPSLGLEVKKSNLRYVRSLRRKTSLILLRWQSEPTQLHGIVFDGESGSFIDPDFDGRITVRRMQKNLEAIYHVRRISHLPSRLGQSYLTDDRSSPISYLDVQALQA